MHAIYDVHTILYMQTPQVASGSNWDSNSLPVVATQQPDIAVVASFASCCASVAAWCIILNKLGNTSITCRIPCAQLTLYVLCSGIGVWATAAGHGGLFRHYDS
jgi:hypothetical protein